MREYIFSTAFYMAMALPLYLMLRFVVLLVYRRRGEKKIRWGREVALCLFCLCLAGLASQTLMPQFGFRQGRLEAAFSARINLAPFQVFADSAEQLHRNGDKGYFIINFLGNIAMFLPVGFFPPLLSKRYSLWKTVLLGMGISLLIELCQIPLGRGADIDDLWLNTLGAAAGYALFALMRRIWPRAVACCRAERAPKNKEYAN